MEDKLNDTISPYPDHLRYYGINIIIREYIGFKWKIKLPCHWEHGWTSLETPLHTDLLTKKHFMLVYSKRRLKAWQEHSKKPAYILGSPFPLYRKINNINRDADAKGTIAFPAHSCFWVHSEFNIIEYCEKLKSLPEKFKPINICLHEYDILIGRDKIFKENGFNVFSAGEQNSPSFHKEFYNILKKHLYSTSNTVGSYTFYAVDMEIPFFIFGDIPLFENKENDPNVPSGKYSILDFKNALISYDLFNTGPVDIISDEQKYFVDFENGINDKISPYFLKRMIMIYSFFDLVIQTKKNFVKKYLSFKKRLQYFYEIFYLKINNLYFYSKIFTHMTNQEKILLYKVAKSMKGNIVAVEIGSYLGASACFITAGINKKSKLYCIDTWGNHAMKYSDKDSDSYERDTFQEFTNNTFFSFNKIIPIRKWSYEAIDDLKKEIQYIDYLFIDGNHNYDGVKMDWDLYSPFLKKGSTVVFHDTGWADGIRRVINEDVLKKAKRIKKLPNIEVFKIYC